MRPRFSEKEMTVDEVSIYYEDSLKALRTFKQDVLQGSSPYLHDFLHMNKKEVDNYFKLHEEELDRLACFSLLSSVEASLRIDFYQRISKNRKNEFARRLYDHYLKEGNRISLENHILEEWRGYRADKRHVFSAFIGMLNYRDWLAHGRYWIANLPRKHIDYYILLSICSDVESVIKEV